MSQSHSDQRLDMIAFHSTSPSIEESFTAAARDVFGELQIAHLDNGGAPSPEALDRALLVISHPETAESVQTLRQLRGRGIGAPALLLVQSEGADFEADLAELGPAAAFPAEGYALEDLENCVRAQPAKNSPTKTLKRRSKGTVGITPSRWRERSTPRKL